MVCHLSIAISFLSFVKQHETNLISYVAFKIKVINKGGVYLMNITSIKNKYYIKVKWRENDEVAY